MRTPVCKCEGVGRRGRSAGHHPVWVMVDAGVIADVEEQRGDHHPARVAAETGSLGDAEERPANYPAVQSRCLAATSAAASDNRYKF